MPNLSEEIKKFEKYLSDSIAKDNAKGIFSWRPRDRVFSAAQREIVSNMLREIAATSHIQRDEIRNIIGKSYQAGKELFLDMLFKNEYLDKNLTYMGYHPITFSGLNDLNGCSRMFVSKEIDKRGAGTTCLQMLHAFKAASAKDDFEFSLQEVKESRPYTSIGNDSL